MDPTSQSLAQGPQSDVSPMVEDFHTILQDFNLPPEDVQNQQEIITDLLSGNMACQL